MTSQSPRTGTGKNAPEQTNPETPTFRFGTKEVTFTHLDRLYYPQAGYTKAEVLDYYLRVAPYLLPHVRGRALTLERWPEGIEDGSFFQKNASSYFPSWLRTYPVERKDHQKIVHYPVVEDEADLLYLVNQGTLTFHTQMARIDDPEHPDIMVLDVDPPEDEAAAAAAPAARAGAGRRWRRPQRDSADGFPGSQNTRGPGRHRDPVPPGGRGGLPAPRAAAGGRIGTGGEDLRQAWPAPGVPADRRPRLRRGARPTRGALRRHGGPPPRPADHPHPQEQARRPGLPRRPAHVAGRHHRAAIRGPAYARGDGVDARSPGRNWRN